MSYHHFNTELACEVGVTKAVLLENIAFWIEKNVANNKHFYKDNYWTYNSIKAFADIFPYISIRRLERELRELIDDDYLVSDNFNKNPYDRTKWYALSNKSFKYFKKICPKNSALIDTQKNVNEFNEKREPIPDNNTDNKQYIEKEKNILKKEKDFENFENVEVVENIKANNEVVNISNDFSTSNIVSISKDLAFNSYEVVETPRINKNLVLWESEEDKLLEKEFDLFYSLYPRKTSKMNAKSAFKKLRLGQHKNYRKTKIPLDNILLALSSLIKQIGRNGTKIEYIPYPASWLNSNDFLSVTDDETALLPQDNQTCLNEIKEMLKKMAEVMNEKFKENPQFKEMPEYKIIRREILTKCILNIKDICNKYNVCFYKYYGFSDDDTSEFKRYKWYLEKSFSDWIKESINI